MAENEIARLKRWFSIIPHSPDEVELRHGVWNPISVTLTDDSQSGRLFRLLRRLDGSMPPAQIAGVENVPREDVEGLIDHLMGLGLIEMGPSTSLDFFLDNNIQSQAPRESNETRPVILLGDAAITEQLQALLKRSAVDISATLCERDDPAWRALTDSDRSWLEDGLAFEEKLASFDSWEDALLVYASRVVDPVTLRVLNRVCLARKINWMYTALDGPFILVGPIFIPGRSACYECLDTRVMMNLRESASYQRYKTALAERQVVHGELPVEPAILSVLASHACLELLNFGLTGRSFTVGKILTIHLPTMEFSYNDLLRLPSCPACMSKPELDDTELYFDMSTVLTTAPDGVR